MSPAKVVVCRLEVIDGVEVWVPYTSPALTASEMGEAIGVLKAERWRRVVKEAARDWEAASAPTPGGEA